MELEKLLIKENAKKIVVTEPSINSDSLREVYDTNFARTRVPNIYEHQYAEYISGLKPPYTDLGGRYQKGNAHQKDARHQNLMEIKE